MAALSHHTKAYTCVPAKLNIPRYKRKDGSQVQRAAPDGDADVVVPLGQAEEIEH
jgi:hypothetical protein